MTPEQRAAEIVEAAQSGQAPHIRALRHIREAEAAFHAQYAALIEAADALVFAADHGLDPRQVVADYRAARAALKKGETK